MSSAEMDHPAERLALRLTIAGALTLTTGVATWLITAVGRFAAGKAAADLRLASLALVAGGAVCGLAMGFALAAAGRGRPAGPPVPAGETGPACQVADPADPAGTAPSLAGPRSLMNPPPPDPPPLAAPRLAAVSGDPQSSDRVWWRAARRPPGGWDDTSEEWLRSLRGPAVQQPPPHSAE